MHTRVPEMKPLSGFLNSRSLHPACQRLLRLWTASPTPSECDIQKRVQKLLKRSREVTKLARLRISRSQQMKAPVGSPKRGFSMEGADSQQNRRSRKHLMLKVNEGTSKGTGVEKNKGPAIAVDTVDWATAATISRVSNECNQMIARYIAGNEHFGEMEEDGSLSLMVSEVWEGLQTLKEKKVKVTLEIVQQMACRWMYQYIGAKDKKLIAHPPCVKKIPSNWRAEQEKLQKTYSKDNIKTYYPSKKDFTTIGAPWGLDAHRVETIFVNERKRVLKKNPEARERLKSHFSRDISNTLRAWQSLHPGRRLPLAAERQKLVSTTGLTEKQIEYWFNNHGRDRSKKATNRTSP